LNVHVNLTHIYISQSTEYTEITVSSKFSADSSVQCGHSPTQSHISHPQYILLTYTDQLLCLQLKTEGTSFFAHFSLTVECSLLTHSIQQSPS